jgi:hypothetical protein
MDGTHPLAYQKSLARLARTVEEKFVLLVAFQYMPSMLASQQESPTADSKQKTPGTFTQRFSGSTTLLISLTRSDIQLPLQVTHGYLNGDVSPAITSIFYYNSVGGATAAILGKSTQRCSDF